MSEHPNAGVVAGLRECADWLEQHPELPVFSNGYVGTYPVARDARAALTAVAEALGDRAIEKAGGNRVEIRGHFGPICVGGNASISSLDPAVQPVPRYEPIIPARSEAA